MLSSVEKLVDKTFVIGFLLPSIIAVYAAMNVFHCPSWFTSLCDPNPAKPFEDLTYLALTVFVLAVFLLTVNDLAYRFLEGELPPISWLRGPISAFHKRRLENLVKKRKMLVEKKKDDEATTLGIGLLKLYPKSTDDVKPTQFGNVVRSFEVYSWDVYRVDGVVVWERLQTVIPSDFLKSINDARSRADFYVNICLLALAFAAIAGAKLLQERLFDPRLLVCDPRPLVQALAAGIFIALLAYRMSIGPLIAWGDTVKSAFDCYLPALVAQLGYEVPGTESKRRAFWDDMAGVFSYRELFDDGRWRLAKPAASSSSGSPGTHDGGGDDD
jgi:hypothetical protein